MSLYIRSCAQSTKCGPVLTIHRASKFNTFYKTKLHCDGVDWNELSYVRLQ